MGNINVYYKNKKLLNCKVLKNFRVIKGLMFSKKLEKNKGVILDLGIEKERIFSSVHMLFVFQELDIIFLNDKLQIVDKVRLKPFELNYTPKGKTRFIIETNSKIISNLKVGDKLQFKKD